MLSVPLHIASTACVGLAAFLLSVLFGKYLVAWGAGELAVVVLVACFTGTAIYIFDRFVPAKCPRCGGAMYGDGSAHRWWKRCLRCHNEYTQ